MKVSITGILKRKKTLFFVVFLIGVVATAIIWRPWVKGAEASSYILGTVAKGDLSTTVSGSGQVSVLKSVNITPETSGKIVSVKVKNGQDVKSGSVIAIIDQRDAASDLSRARASLLSAQASYDKTIAGVVGDDLKLYKLSLESSQASYDSAVKDLETVKRTTQESVKQAEETLADLIDESPSSVNNDRAQLLVTLDSKISSARSSLDKMKRLLENDDAENSLSVFNYSYLNAADNDYQNTKDLLSGVQNDLAVAKSLRSDQNLQAVVNSVIDLLRGTADTASNLFSALENSSPTIDFSQSEIDSNKTSMSSELSSLNTSIVTVQTAWQTLKDDAKEAQNDLEDAKLSADQSIESAQSKIDSAWRSLETAKVQYEKNIAPPTAEEIASAKSSLLSAQALVRSAQTAYEKTVVKALLDGKLDGFETVVGDQVGQSSIGTIMTDQKIAVIPFNEVDTAKIKVGQSAKLTFDAIEDISIKGKVIEVASTGKVNQGIVNYDVKISLDEADERIKTEMSVSAVITVETKTGILLVPSEVVKSQGETCYVEIPLDISSDSPQDNKAPYTGGVTRKIVSIGISDDTYTEITNGVNDGEKVVQKTITVSTKPSTTSTNKAGSNNSANVMRMGGQFTGGFGR